MNNRICLNCFEYKDQCICHRIEGYDPKRGYPIVSITEHEWIYINCNFNQKGSKEIS
jgi:hypothetical protein